MLLASNNSLVQLFVKRGKLYTVQFKTCNCIVFTNFHHTKLYSLTNPNLEFILKISLKCYKFQLRHPHKIYSYEKERVFVD